MKPGDFIEKTQWRKWQNAFKITRLAFVVHVFVYMYTYSHV